MQTLTQRQEEIVRFLLEFRAATGMAPTVYEIADAFSIKTSSVFGHLKALQRKGVITRTSQARSIRVLTGPDAPPVTNRHVEVPVLRRLPRDRRAIADPDMERTLVVDRRATGPGTLFAVRVSDRQAARLPKVCADDLLVLRETVTAKPGELTLAVRGKTVALTRCTAQMAKTAAPVLGVVVCLVREGPVGHAS